MPPVGGHATDRRLSNPYGRVLRAIGCRADGRVAATLGSTLVAALYLDRAAHPDGGGVEPLATPAHELLYGTVAVLTLWFVARRRYRWELAALGVLTVTLTLDLTSGAVPGPVAPLDLLTVLLTASGVVAITGPVRTWRQQLSVGLNHEPVLSWATVTSLVAATALTGLAVGYVSAFVVPAAAGDQYAPSSPLDDLGAAGLAGYLISTLLIILPLAYLSRRAALPHGIFAVTVAALGLPGALLAELTYLLPAAAAVAAASVLDVVRILRPSLPEAVLLALTPATVWGGQLAGLAALDMLPGPLAWSATNLGLTALTGASVTLLTTPPAMPARPAPPDPLRLFDDPTRTRTNHHGPGRPPVPTVTHASSTLSPLPPTLRSMSPADLSWAVGQHLQYFPDGFFAQLGPRFLSRYYRTFFDQPTGVALVADHPRGRGYLVGILHPERHRRTLLARHGRALASLGAWALLRRPQLAATFITTRLGPYLRALHGTRRTQPSTAAEPAALGVVSYLAVEKPARGAGLGRRLLDTFTAEAARSGCTKIVLVTEAHSPAAIYYRSLGWTHVHSTENVDGRVLSTFQLDIDTSSRDST